MSGRLGPIELRLTASQSVAWHSDDADEREDMRQAIRRRARAELDASPRAAWGAIVDYGGGVLERVER